MHLTKVSDDGTTSNFKNQLGDRSTEEPLYCGHFGTLEIVLSIEVSSIQRLNDTVEPLYYGHYGTLEIVLSIEVSSIQRLNDALKYSGISLLWTLWDLGNCP